MRKKELLEVQEQLVKQIHLKELPKNIEILIATLKYDKSEGERIYSHINRTLNLEQEQYSFLDRVVLRMAKRKLKSSSMPKMYKKIRKEISNGNNEKLIDCIYNKRTLFDYQQGFAVTRKDIKDLAEMPSAQRFVGTIKFLLDLLKQDVEDLLQIAEEIKEYLNKNNLKEIEKTAD